jgi:hypothetical protein
MRTEVGDTVGVNSSGTSGERECRASGTLDTPWIRPSPPSFWVGGSAHGLAEGFSAMDGALLTLARMLRAAKGALGDAWAARKVLGAAWAAAKPAANLDAVSAETDSARIGGGEEEMGGAGCDTNTGLPATLAPAELDCQMTSANELPRLLRSRSPPTLPLATPAPFEDPLASLTPPPSPALAWLARIKTGDPCGPVPVLVEHTEDERDLAPGAVDGGARSCVPPVPVDPDAGADGGKEPDGLGAAFRCCERAIPRAEGGPKLGEAMDWGPKEGE